MFKITETRKNTALWHVLGIIHPLIFDKCLLNTYYASDTIGGPRDKADTIINMRHHYVAISVGHDDTLEVGGQGKDK